MRQPAAPAQRWREGQGRCEWRGVACGSPYRLSVWLLEGVAVLVDERLLRAGPERHGGAVVRARVAVTLAVGLERRVDEEDRVVALCVDAEEDHERRLLARQARQPVQILELAGATVAGPGDVEHVGVVG